MPAYSRQLKDEDDNIIYPITTAENVVDTDGVDLQTRVDTGVYLGTGSVSSLSPWVDTSDIMDGAVTADKIDFSTMPGNYSLTEVNTGYAWVDGSPIYKKTVKYDNGINPNTEVEIPHDITNLARCIKIEAFGAGGTPGSGNCLMLPAKSYGGPSLSVWTVTPTVIKLNSISLQYTDSIYFTLYYTKLLS